MATNATTYPVIVLIHGSWHFPSHYSTFTTQLRERGHEVHAPRLPTMNGARPPTADLETDSDFIRAYVEGLVSAGREVIVLMHSYGGQVGTNALAGLGRPTRQAQGLAGGVVHLVYINAFAVVEGTSMADVVEAHGNSDLMPLAFDFAKDQTVMSRDFKKLIVGPGRPDDETDAYIAAFRPHNGKAWYDKIQHCAWREVPRITYIQTTLDMNVPIHYQKKMVETLEKEGKQVTACELETGHCPTFTMPEEVAKIVHELAVEN
ncbi:alpha/beta hydrolase [Aspergillus homomorphus CBS 101889]|uniref:Alpha/beta-hydrolase n=1 Tax=Aspergillus homomorphus (strain CBS 101889) TaxID=1450537 RepID=A0A395HG27_ASPHC|nr:alpha/beta-hydrolase [Aspergillus homomorphus CBS 101889]RAL06807.1 alpha/beta-hydrolase [Aspergillus homomorphus CBS 101889]